MDNIVDVGRLWQIIKRNALLMALLGVASGSIAYGIATHVMQPQYRATAALLVNRKATSGQQGVQLGDQQADVQLIQTYKDILTRPIILNDAIKRLELPTKVEKVPRQPAKHMTDAFGRTVEITAAQPAQYEWRASKYVDSQLTTKQLVRMVNVSSLTNSQVFSINVDASNPTAARDIANAIADAFQAKILDIMAVSNVSIVSRATRPTEPSAPNKQLMVLAGLVVGVGLGLVIGVVRELTDRTIKTETFMTDELGLTNLGTITGIGRLKERRVMLSEQGVSRIKQRI
ncbi:YveK family protein [Weissella sp. MSCH1]|uniref:YveK family protein n=1 Tax=Weissella sp. MSCH1 TaxID=3383343 RepID=UPI0038968B9D